MYSETETGVALEQQRASKLENEEFVAVLQSAHDDLAARLVVLDAQHSELCLERQQDATLLVEIQEERDRLQASVDKHRRTDERAQIAIIELQCSIIKAEERLESAEEDFSHRQRAHTEDLARLEADVEAKGERVAELEDLLKDALSREQELAKLRIRIEARDKQLLRMEHVLDETREEADALRRDTEEKGIKVARQSNQVQEVEEELQVLRKDWKAALRQNTAKDSIIGVLRDKLQTAGYAADEAKAIYTTEIERLKLRIGELDAEVEVLRADRTAAKEDLFVVQAEKIAELEAALTSAMEEINGWEQHLADVETAAEVAEKIAILSLEGERRVWSLEKEEVRLNSMPKSKPNVWP